MSRVVKILKITGIAVTSMIVILMAASFFMQDKVADIVLKRLNNKIITKYEYSAVKFSFLRRFPKASLELKDVVVHSSHGFEKKIFPGVNTDTLLWAKTVSVDFKITDIINGEYNIDNIETRNGTVMLLTDKEGNVNYEFTANDGSNSGKPLILDINKITLSNVSALYQNMATVITIAGEVEKGTLRTRISGKNVDFTAEGSVAVSLLKVSYLNISSPFDTEVNIGLKRSGEGVRLENSTLKINKNKVEINGLVGDDYIDLAISGSGINIAGIKEYLPTDIGEKVAGYSPAGTLNIDGTIKGKNSRTSLPYLNFGFDIENGAISRSATSMSLTGLTIVGSYSNGNQAAPSTSSLKIDDFKGAINNYIFRGSVNILSFDAPKVSVVMDGQGDAKDLTGFFDLKEITSASGKLAINIKAKGIYNRETNYRLPDILGFSPTLIVKADSFSVNLKNNRFVVDNVSGTLTVTNSIVADNLYFTYKEQDIFVDGSFTNLTSWLMGENVTVTSNAGLKADKLYPERFISNSGGNRSREGNAKNIKFPDDMVFDLTVDIGEFGYQNIYAEDMMASVSYKPTLLNIKSLDAGLLGGTASANGFLVKNSDLTLMARGSFDLKNVDIHECFSMFNNFGQDYIKSENIEGDLSGQVSALVSMDSLFRPNMKTLMVEGNYIINNGALLDFEPIKKLSNFIELSELENIRFASLQNELIIRSNYIYIPQMDIKSSAADLSISGKYSFDNDYEYHVKILLSEILSNKFRTKRGSNLEFGAVQDDGLGRTSILLAIDNKGVRYDMKAVGEQIRREIRQEGQNLRTILNEEYGWFDGDSQETENVEEQGTETGNRRFNIDWEENINATETDSTPEKESTGTTTTTPRFRISWDDSPGGEAEEEEVEAEESRGLKGIFRKN